MPKRHKKKASKAARKAVKKTKAVKRKAVKRMAVSRPKPVKSVASRDASAVIKETRGVHSALTELTRDVKRIGALERNVAQLKSHMASEVATLNKKLSSAEQRMTQGFNSKISTLGSKVESSMRSMSSSMNSKMAQQNEHFNDRLASLHSEMKIANGNASRRMDNIEEAILKMHEAVEALNGNWVDFTHSLMVEEKKK